MPRIPKWLGDAIEKISNKHYHPVEVTEVTYLNESLKKVRFEGDLGSVSFIPGQVVEFRVNDTDYRHYTPAVFDGAHGACEVVFYLHGKGPGSAWASELAIGQQLKMIGPGGKMAYRRDFPLHVVFGDETSIGLLTCMRNECEHSGDRFLGLLEFAPAHMGWQIGHAADTTIVSASMDVPAEQAVGMVEELRSKFPSLDTCFYLTGRAKSIQRLRDYLIKTGVPRKHILMDPYWAEGKRGL